MVTNFDYEYAKAMQKYEDARTLQEKVVALELMKSTAPSHKGAEKLRLDISRKLSKLKEKLEQEMSKKGSTRGMTVKKEGAVQVVLAGLPNSGKSSLLKSVTNATPLIANYEFTTTEPEIGVMEYKGAKIQMVEIPAIIEGTSRGKARGREKISIIRNSDFIIFPFIGNENIVKKQVDILVNEISTSGILLNRKKPGIIIKKNDGRGIDVVGKQNLMMDEESLISLLKSRGIVSATIILEEKTDWNKMEEAIDNSLAYKSAIGIWLDNNENMVYNGITIYGCAGFDTNKLKEAIYSHLDLIMIYTRKPNEKDKDNVPVVLKKGSTIYDLCNMLHNDFIERFNYARVWGSSKFSGQVVSKEFVLKDKDVVEIYVKR